MHRQSIGSPASKLHSHGVVVVGGSAGVGVIKEDMNGLTTEDLQNHRKDKLAASFSSAVSAATVVDDDEEHKPQKPHHQKSMLFSSSSSPSSRLIHLIPILTLFCFLILYLSSHDPSRKDLAQVGGFTVLSSKKSVIDSTDIDDFAGRFLETEKNDILAIRSLRNLQQQVNQRRRLNRKFRQ